MLAAYLHEDWPEEYDGDVWRAVEDFAASEPKSIVDSVHRQVRILLEHINEQAARELISQARIAYRPPADGYTYRGWLVALAAFLEER